MLQRILTSTAVATILAAGAVSAQQPAQPSVPAPVVAHPMAAAHHVAVVPTRKPIRHPRHMARANSTVRLRESSPGLIKEAKVPVATALQTALAQQKGTVTSERIERRGGELVYAFNIRSGQRLHHVVVNAMTGAVVAPQARTVSSTVKSTAKSPARSAARRTVKK